MTSSLNVYGDKLAPTTGKHGSNISEQRLDELDQACLDFVKTRVSETGSCQAVDIGAGSGPQSKRMAELGASALMIDLTDQYQSVKAFNAGLGHEAIRFFQKDVREMAVAEWPEKIDCVYSQRMLSAIPYAEALKLLQTLKSRAMAGAHFFLSAGGLDSEYKEGYPDAEKPVEERWAKLAPAMGAKHNVLIPQCLYHADDLSHLLEKAGLTVLRSWTSAFGNVKAVARA